MPAANTRTIRMNNSLRICDGCVRSQRLGSRPGGEIMRLDHPAVKRKQAPRAWELREHAPACLNRLSESGFYYRWYRLCRQAADRGAAEARICRERADAARIGGQAAVWCASCDRQCPGRRDVRGCYSAGRDIRSSGRDTAPESGQSRRVQTRRPRIDQGCRDAARDAGVQHFVYVSVAHPAPVMQAYIAVRAEGEALVRASRIRATILRPWYVLGPGHRWPYLLLPVYAILRRVPMTRSGAERLGLVTRREMVAALVRAIEAPPAEAVRVMEVPEIRAG